MFSLGLYYPRKPIAGPDNQLLRLAIRRYLGAWLGDRLGCAGLTVGLDDLFQPK